MSCTWQKLTFPHKQDDSIAKNEIDYIFHIKPTHKGTKKGELWNIPCGLNCTKHKMPKDGFEIKT